jgi:hypothetical protein
MPHQPTRRRMLTVTAVVAIALSFSPAGETEEKSLVVNGKPLKLLGTGLREFLFIDIYSLSAFSESGACKPTDIVYKSETKALRLTMLRNIPVDRLTSNLKSTFEDNMPKKGDIEALQKKIESFLSYFKKDLTKGTEVEITYVPGQGTIARRNGRAMGPAIRGSDFAQLVWRSYFGGNTCCSSLKSEIISACKKGGS